MTCETCNVEMEVTFGEEDMSKDSNCFRKHHLIVKDRLGEKIFEIEHDESKGQTVVLQPRFGKDLESWQEHGLMELVTPGLGDSLEDRSNVYHRTTPWNHHKLVEHLMLYFMRCSGFGVEFSSAYVYP